MLLNLQSSKQVTKILYEQHRVPERSPDGRNSAQIAATREKKWQLGINFNKTEFKEIFDMDTWHFFICKSYSKMEIAGSSKMKERVQTELKILKAIGGKVCHPNLVRLRHFFNTKTDVYFVFEAF